MKRVLSKASAFLDRALDLTLATPHALGHCGRPLATATVAGRANWKHANVVVDRCQAPISGCERWTESPSLRAVQLYNSALVHNVNLQ